MRIILENVDNLSKELAQMSLNYNPECVISIKNGGYNVGKVIADTLSLPHYSIRIESWCSDLGHNNFVRYMCNSSPLPLSRISSYIAAFIRDRAGPKLADELNGDIDLDARVLLVDDSITTGKTIRFALNYLKREGFENIKTAAIAYTNRGKGRFIPDYYVISDSVPIVFPWGWEV